MRHQIRSHHQMDRAKGACTGQPVQVTMWMRTSSDRIGNVSTNMVYDAVMCYNHMMSHVMGWSSLLLHHFDMRCAPHCTLFTLFTLGYPPTYQMELRVIKRLASTDLY